MSTEIERKRMASSPGQAIARQKEAEENLQPPKKSNLKSQLEKSHREIEDSLDYTVVRHARVLAKKRGEQPMAWEEFKKKLER